MPRIALTLSAAVIFQHCTCMRTYKYAHAPMHKHTVVTNVTDTYQTRSHAVISFSTWHMYT